LRELSTKGAPTPKRLKGSDGSAIPVDKEEEQDEEDVAGDAVEEATSANPKAALMLRRGIIESDEED
jgi:hypothetical protein